MKLSIRLASDDDPRVASDIGFRELVALERDYGMNYEDVQEAGRLEPLCYLGYKALEFRGRYDGDFEDFLGDVVSIDIQDEGGDNPPPADPPADE